MRKIQPDLWQRAEFMHLFLPNNHFVMNRQIHTIPFYLIVLIWRVHSCSHKKLQGGLQGDETNNFSI